MATEKMAVLGVYANRPSVDRAVGELIAAGFHESEFSAILPNDRGEAKVEEVKNREPKGVADKVTDLTSKDTKDISSGRPRDVPADNTKIPQGGATGAGIGALLIAGPLFGAFAGATAGGAVGVLVGLGIPEDEAKLYYFTFGARG